MMKPTEIAIAKCAAHRHMSRVTKGNIAADEAAKAVTGAKSGHVLLVTHEVTLEDKISMRDVILMQEAVPAVEKQLWIERGASQEASGLWRNHEGLMVAPPDLLGLLIQEAHGQAHVARGEVRRKLTSEYGFWAPNLLQQIDHVIGKCVICLKNNVRRGILIPPGHVPTPKGPPLSLLEDEMKTYVKYLAALHNDICTYVRNRPEQEAPVEQKSDVLKPGDKVFVKVFRRKWFNERREGPYEVVRNTGTAVQVKGSPTWYHPSHCVKAPTEDTPCLKVLGPEDSVGQKNGKDQLPDGVNNDSDILAADGIDINDTGNDNAENEQERRFDNIDLQHAPGTTESPSPELKPTERQKSTSNTQRKSRRTVIPGRPRPSRQRIKPKRYQGWCCGAGRSSSDAIT
ncbi:uncharacterized protein LOC106533546 [Austrofundulus limnaeus]|uniref:Uncharacterized protein LOC106533546 n=1 Tax=Austrofundulus limnaeus TaxID=52670 RepID=A0A2I4CZC3_AUSLI|nr:PREDICTED: uncharacterized protein LOC106533546 [Austrofundulus limnaeus]